MRGREYSAPSRGAQGGNRQFGRNSIRPLVEVKGRCLSSECLELRRTRSPAPGSRKLAVPTATALAPHREEIERIGARFDASHPRPSARSPRRDPADLVERDGPHRGPREPAAPRAEPWLARGRIERRGAQGVDQARPRPPRPPRPPERRPPDRPCSASASRSTASRSAGAAPRRAPSSPRAARRRSDRTRRWDRRR